MFFAIGALGWTFVPILIGGYARRVGVQRAFSVAVVAAVGLTIMTIVLMVRLGAGGRSQQSAVDIRGQKSGARKNS